MKAHQKWNIAAQVGLGISIVLAILGIGIMVGGRLQIGDTMGVAVAILGIVFFGVYAVSLRVGKNVDMTPAVFYGGAIGTTVSFSISIGTGVGLAIPWIEAMWCTLLGVVQVGLGSVLFALAAQGVPAVQLTLFALGEPLLAPLWVWLMLDDLPTMTTLIGGAVLFAALALQVSASRK